MHTVPVCEHHKWYRRLDRWQIIAQKTPWDYCLLYCSCPIWLKSSLCLDVSLMVSYTVLCVQWHTVRYVWKKLMHWYLTQRLLGQWKHGRKKHVADSQKSQRRGKEIRRKEGRVMWHSIKKRQCVPPLPSFYSHTHSHKNLLYGTGLARMAFTILLNSRKKNETFWS